MSSGLIEIVVTYSIADTYITHIEAWHFIDSRMAGLTAFVRLSDIYAEGESMTTSQVAPVSAKSNCFGALYSYY